MDIEKHARNILAAINLGKAAGLSEDEQIAGIKTALDAMPQKPGMSRGEYMRILSNCAIRYKKSNIPESVTRNSHMNELSRDSVVDEKTADAVVVDFVNFVGCQMAMDYGMYTEDLVKEEEQTT